MRTMSKRIQRTLALSAILLMAAAVPLFAQVNAAGLYNATGGTAYVISLPTNSAEFNAMLNNPGELKDVIRQYADQIIVLPSGGLYRSLPLYRQDSLVFGYILEAGQLEHPLFALRIAAGDGGSYFEINENDLLKNGQGGYVGFSSIEDQLPAQTGQQIDGRIIDWLQVPDALRFARSFTPLRARRESSATSIEISLDNAVYWGKGGTGIDRVRITVNDDFLYGMMSSYQELQDGLSVLLYYYRERTEKSVNLYTLEIPIAGTTGHVLLWKENGQVEIVGNYHRGDFFVEFQINREFLPTEINQSLDGQREGSFDVSTGFTDGQIFEEFLYGNVSINSIITE